jgi:hypothetical protein
MKTLKKITYLFLFVSAIFTLSACVKEKDPVVNETPEVTSVTIKTTELSYSVQAGKFTLNVEVLVKGNASQEVTYESNNLSVATISTNGEVTPLAEGSVTITVTSKFDTTKSDTIDLAFFKERTPINGGFELSNPVWGFYTNGANSVCEVDNEVKYTGDKALKVQNDGNYTVIWHGVEMGVENDLVVGDFIKLSAYVYSPLANAGSKPVLMIETVNGADEKQIIVKTPMNYVETANEWVKLETAAVKIPEGVTLFNVKAEFHEQGLLYIDEINITKAESNDVTLDYIKVDDVELANITDLTQEVSVAIASIDNLPVVTAAGNDANTTVTVVQATSETMAATVTLTAKDNTTRTVTINFKVANLTDLNAISVDGVALSNFRADRTYYYVLLAKGTTANPAITYQKASSSAADVLTLPQSLPGTATIQITEAEQTQTYEIYLDVISDTRLMLGYPDMDFERADMGGTPRNWGFYSTVLSNEDSHSGTYSLKAENNGGSGWVGMDLAGGENYPAKGDQLIAGVWVKATAVGDVTLEIFGKEAQGQIANLVYNIKEEQLGKWIYIESATSTAVADDCLYAQIVIKNYTGAAVFFDDITLKRAS